MNERKDRYGHFLAGISLAPIAAMLIATAPAMAQGNGANGMDEIIVTAQKRSEKINDVGMAITAATGDMLQARGISDASQLSKIEPAFQYTKSNYGAPVYSLRGVGFYDTSLGATPAVTVYLDQVPVPYSVMTRSVGFDLERVEILKGPQGTLFGQNSTGGAVNYIAAKPTNQFEAGLDASYGRFNSLDTTAFVSGPLSDTLKARLAVHAEQAGDWQRSYTRSDSLGSVDQLYARLLLDWQPTDGFSLQFNANGGRDKSDATAGQLIAVLNQRLSAPIRNYPLAPSNARAADWDANTPFRRNDHQYQFSLTGSLDFSSDVALKSITSYARYNLNMYQDVDGTSYQVFHTRDVGTIKTFSQELRLQNAGNSALKWTVGGNYSHDAVSDSLTSISPLGVAGLSGILSANPRNTQSIDSLGLFANVDYPILTGVSAHGGIRYTKQWRDFTGCSYDTGDGSLAGARAALSSRPDLFVAGGCTTLNAQRLPAQVVSQLNEDNISWRVGLDWKVAPNSLLYANISKGYKAGAYPTAGATFASTYTPATQESLLAYEAGFKLSLADRMLQLNGAVFYYDYRDKQIRGRVVDPVYGSLTRLINIPKSREIGVELAATLRPVKGLSLNASTAYLDSKISGSFINLDALGISRELGGGPFPYTPKWAVNGSANYEFPLSDRVNMFVQADYNYKGSSYSGLGEVSLFRLDSYSTVDLRTGISSEDGSWRASIWGRNITNSYYWNNVVSPTSDTVLRYPGMPVTYGVSLSFRYR